MIFGYTREKLLGSQLEIMSAFSTLMAHEVRSPLAHIMMCIDRIVGILKKYRGNIEDNARQYAIPVLEDDIIYQMFNDMSFKGNGGIQVVEMLLMASKSDIIVEPNENTMSKTAKVALENLVIKPEEREKITLKIVEDFKYIGSEMHFVHIIWNFVYNSLKYGLYNRPDARVTVEVGDNYVSVMDTGNGIEPSVASRVFEKFYTTSQSGTGVGLAFCDLVIKKYRGQIKCESEVGEYTKFTFHLPKENLEERKKELELEMATRLKG